MRGREEKRDGRDSDGEEGEGRKYVEGGSDEALHVQTTFV